MKNIFSLVALLMTIVFFSCEKDLSESENGTGNIHIDIGSVLNVHDLGGGLKTIPSVEDFKVMVYQADGTLAMTFETVFEMPDTIELAIGDYFVEAFSDNNLPAAFDNPYYFGSTEVFTISSNMYHSVEVLCKLTNSVVSVIYSENIISNFANYSTTVTSALGSLVFNETETRKGYFEPSALDISVDLSYLKPDGSVANRNLSGNIPAPQANRHYQISVDASIFEGMASFLIMQDSTELIMEYIDISDNQDSLSGGSIAYGDLLISEIMYDPSTLSDTEGEWIEIYNNSDQAINLQNLILKRDDTNLHVITDSIVLQPSEYYVCSRTVQATAASNQYVYGSAITLSNTGAVLSIYNEELDGSPGVLIFSVNYGEADFPSGSGISISLNPALLNVVDAVLGTSWCKSTSSYNTGDLGTPGLSNDTCQ